MINMENAIQEAIFITAGMICTFYLGKIVQDIEEQGRQRDKAALEFKIRNEIKNYGKRNK